MGHCIFENEFIIILYHICCGIYMPRQRAGDELQPAAGALATLSESWFEFVFNLRKLYACLQQQQ
jgi:hypothetical protein